jgi:hypothetical protein
LMVNGKDKKALNALDIPMPGGTQSAGDFATDCVAWQETTSSASHVELDAQYPTADMRWGLCATSGREWHG